MTKTVDREANKIQERRWDAIRNEWRNYVPNVRAPWPFPAHEIYELTSVENIMKRMMEKGELETLIHDDIEGLRTAVLHDAVTTLHKASNVARAGADNGEDGYRTWSRSSAYHSAFFAMKSVLGLLGVVVLRNRDHSADFQIDLWAARDRKRKPGETDSPFAIRIVKRHKRVQHKELWSVFSRVMRIAKIDNRIWPKDAITPLGHMEPGDFSFVRHLIHYRHGWLFEDVHDDAKKDDLSQLAATVKDLRILSEPDSSEFPFVLALHVGSFASALIADLGSYVPAIMEESRTNSRWMELSPWRTANAFALSVAGEQA